MNVPITTDLSDPVLADLAEHPRVDRDRRRRLAHGAVTSSTWPHRDHGSSLT